MYSQTIVSGLGFGVAAMAEGGVKLEVGAWR
jgi:hypothetical protein